MGNMDVVDARGKTLESGEVPAGSIWSLREF